MSPSSIDTGSLRSLLAELLRSDPDFEAFCINHFPEVHRRFGRGMERKEKENLLLVHAPRLEDIVTALRQEFPESKGREPWPPFEQKKTPRSKRVVAVAAAGFGIVLGSLPFLRSSVGNAPDDCGALAVDDLFVVKTQPTDVGTQLALDVRMRHRQSSQGPLQITRALLQCMDRTAERAPIAPSASYDLLIAGEQNEVALAQRLNPGDVDRALIRLGFTAETGAYQYTAKLKLFYNGSCSFETRPFALAQNTAHWAYELPPLPRTP